MKRAIEHSSRPDSPSATFLRLDSLDYLHRFILFSAWIDIVSVCIGRESLPSIVSCRLIANLNTCQDLQCKVVYPSMDQVENEFEFSHCLFQLPDILVTFLAHVDFCDLCLI